MNQNNAQFSKFGQQNYHQNNNSFNQQGHGRNFSSNYNKNRNSSPHQNFPNGQNQYNGIRNSYQGNGGNFDNTHNYQRNFSNSTQGFQHNNGNRNSYQGNRGNFHNTNNYQRSFSNSTQGFHNSYQNNHFQNKTNYQNQNRQDAFQGRYPQNNHNIPGKEVYQNDNNQNKQFQKFRPQQNIPNTNSFGSNQFTMNQNSSGPNSFHSGQNQGDFQKNNFTNMIDTENFNETRKPFQKYGNIPQINNAQNQTNTYPRSNGFINQANSFHSFQPNNNLYEPNKFSNSNGFNQNKNKNQNQSIWDGFASNNVLIAENNASSFIEKKPQEPGMNKNKFSKFPSNFQNNDSMTGNNLNMRKEFISSTLFQNQSKSSVDMMMKTDFSGTPFQNNNVTQNMENNSNDVEESFFSKEFWAHDERMDLVQIFPNLDDKTKNNIIDSFL